MSALSAPALDAFRPGKSEGLTDEAIVAYAKNSGGELAMEFIIKKYTPFVRSKVSHYYLQGADHDDLLQEGLIGLYKAVRDFRPEVRNSFRAFADICVTRQVITAIKTADRQKHQALNHYVSVDVVVDEQSGRTLLEVLPAADAVDPEGAYEHQAFSAMIREQIFEVLSALEREVLEQYICGRSYVQISDTTGLHLKSIDNALQRAKRKISEALGKSEEADLSALR